MGRLFWKFFLFLWLAQLFTVIVVSMAIWFIEADRERPGFRTPNAMPGAEAPGFPPPPPLPPPVPGIGFNPPPPPPDPSLRASDAPPADNLPGLERAMQGSPPHTGFTLGGGPPGAPMDQPPPPSERGISPPVLPLIVGSLISLIFAALLARYFARPIRTLSQAFEQVANGRLETRVGESMSGRHDELGDLGSGFDSMAERLQSLVDDKQRLLHDVSHELRSPLARLQAAIDLMQQQPDRSNEFIARIERESSRIDGLVSELLTFARLDSGLPGHQILEFDLIELIQAVADDASFEAETKQCRVATQLPAKACMTGDPDLLHRAIENIVRNAIRHTPETSHITIQGETNSDMTLLTLDIADQGEGVPESDLQLLFEPFYRSPTADRFKGYGIGMAITQRVVDAHKGKVSARNAMHGGLVVSIELPLSDESAC